MAEYRLYLDGVPTEIERFHAESDAAAVARSGDEAERRAGNVELVKVVGKWPLAGAAQAWIEENFPDSSATPEADGGRDG